MSRLDDLAVKFQSEIRRLGRNCNRAEVLFRRGSIRLRDCELIYEASFIASVADFEQMFEAMLVEMIRMGRGTIKGSYSLISAKSRIAIRRVVLGGKPYAEFMPIDKAVKRAAVFLSEPVPFAKIGRAETDILSQAMYVRNAIAHGSEYAAEIFRRKVVGVNDLPLNRRRPGAYLRQEFRGGPAQTRHELYLITMHNVSKLLPLLW